MKDYYEILGVSKTASDQEIKAAYRKQALEWHPDRNKSPEASDRFKQVNKAYEVLSNPQKKQMYDQVGHDTFERGGMPGGSSGGQTGAYQYYTNFGGQGVEFDFDGADPFEIFEQFFGFRSPFGGTGGSRTRQRRAMYEVNLSFEEAVNGVEKTAVIAGKEKKIKIPAGVDNGMRIRFSDFDLQVNVKPHQFFKREGQDIYLEKVLTFSQAALGIVLDIPTIKNNVKIRVRPGTQSGTVIRLRGHGVPYPNSRQIGDQYVVFKVHIPEKLSGKAKKLVEELQQEL
jgi:DnaJ-class molecular chaperone